MPIVEPELLIEGTHSIETSKHAAQRVLHACVAALWHEGVLLEGVLLKPQMVIPGSQWQGLPPSPEEIAIHTLDVMYRCPPAPQRQFICAPHVSTIAASCEVAEGPCQNCDGRLLSQQKMSVQSSTISTGPPRTGWT